MANAMIAAIDLFTWYLPKNVAVEGEFAPSAASRHFTAFAVHAEDSAQKIVTDRYKRPTFRVAKWGFSQERFLHRNDQSMKPIGGDIQKVSPSVLE